ncbi:hypothetical protein [Pseudonocardia pini]|uniref:hypothetical protein n=1 Tax=Pseudonocardia pini TaxID=2758030 RepID=UPI0015F1084C|nr:hypothetical protein [Pseudonocardia pini]
MGTTISLAQWLNAGINVLLPILVAVVTARAAAGAVKALVLLGLSAVSGFLVSWLDALNAVLPFDWSQAGFTTVMGFVVAVAAHFGVWKPGGVTGSEGAVQSTLTAGLGGSGRHTA